MWERKMYWNWPEGRRKPRRRRKRKDAKVKARRIPDTGACNEELMANAMQATGGVPFMLKFEVDFLMQENGEGSKKKRIQREFHNTRLKLRARSPGVVLQFIRDVQRFAASWKPEYLSQPD